MSHPLRIQHEFSEQRILTVGSPGIKMRRTIRIRIFRRKCMRHKIVDSAYQHVIHQIFHHGKPFRPSESPKKLTHRPVLFQRLDMGMGGSKLCQRIMKKFRIDNLPGHRSRMIKHMLSGDHLVQHHIDSRHILSVKRAEIMPRSISEPLMRIHVFNDMTDIHDMMGTAPVSEHIAEITAVLFCRSLHISFSDQRRPSLNLMPQPRQKFPDCFFCNPRFFRDPFRYITAPWNEHILLSQHRIVSVHVIAEGRFIREKACKGIAEILFKMLIVRFIYCMKHGPAGFRRHHVDIIPFRRTAYVMRAYDVINPPYPFRDIPP